MKTIWRIFIFVYFISICAKFNRTKVNEKLILFRCASFSERQTHTYLLRSTMSCCHFYRQLNNTKLAEAKTKINWNDSEIQSEIVIVHWMKSRTTEIRFNLILACGKSQINLIFVHWLETDNFPICIDNISSLSFIVVSVILILWLFFFILCCLGVCMSVCFWTHSSATETNWRRRTSSRAMWNHNLAKKIKLAM